MDGVELGRLNGGVPVANGPRAMLTRRERLERWAQLVERADAEEALSPFEIAYRDPILRSQGFASPAADEAAAFFGIDPIVSDRLGAPLSAPQTRIVARRIRKFAARNDRNMIAAGVAAAGVITVPFLAYLFA